MFRRFEDDHYPRQENISAREELLGIKMDKAKEFLEYALKGLYYGRPFDENRMTGDFEEACTALGLKFKFPVNEDIVGVNRLKIW